MLYFKDNPPFTLTYVNTFSDIPSFHGWSQYVLLPPFRASLLFMGAVNMYCYRMLLFFVFMINNDK